jgi:penicillin amidase
MLDQVRESLVDQWGDWRVPWGNQNRHQRRHWSGQEWVNDNIPSLPVRGGPGWTGVIFNFYTEAPSAGGRRYGWMGNSYVSVVEFGERTQARSIVYFGQSGRPDSPHYFDQAPLYARGEFKPAPTSREEVRAAAAARTYHPGD